MSLDKAAKHLEARGRNGDSMLVHMSPKEVESLQALAMAHGGSLTVNPATGLAEAGFLKNLLPMVAGAAITYFSGGTLGPWASAALVGGEEALRTGDISKGLMAGMGAFGGAGLASGLTTAGASSIADAGGKAAVDQLGSQATNLSADQLANLSPEQIKGLQSVSESGMYNTADVMKTANAANTSAGAQNMLNAQNFPNLNATQLQGLSDTAASGAYSPTEVVRTAGAQNAVSGASNYDMAKAGFGDLGAAWKAAPTGTGMGIATTAVNAATPEPQDMPAISEEPSSGKYISKDFRAYEPTRPNPYYRPQGLGYTGYAMGGPIQQQMPNGGLAGIQGVRDGYGATQTMDGNIPQYATGGKLEMKKMKLGDGIFKDTNPNTANLGAAEAAEYYVRNAAKKNKVPYTKMPKTNIEDLGEINVGPIKAAAAGGSIGGYSDGGRMLKGPGDGMSDSIPATIGSKQPAKLADGEFVVPADVVSHIGNGSTDAGAKRLYTMMDKIRQARTGTKKQGKKIKPEKYMPA